MGKSQKFASDKPSISEIRRLKKPNEKQVDILLEPLLKAKVEEKTREVEQLTRAEQRGRKDLSQKSAIKAQEELDAIMDEVRSESVTFLFRDIGRKKLDTLIAAHRPTEEMKTQWKDEGNAGSLAYNLETFPPALIAACCVDPEMSLEDAQAICEEWGGGDIEALFYGALASCREQTSIPLSKNGTGQMNDSPLSSTMPLTTESPTPSS